MNRIKQTMFPNYEEKTNAPDLSKTMRILPHDQNSGGFYVALIHKLQDFEWSYSSNKANEKKS